MSDVVADDVRLGMLDEGVRGYALDAHNAMVDHLIGAASIAKQILGWKSISIHKSIDGKSVANYAQAESLEAQERIFKVLFEKGIIEKGHQLGEAHQGLYEAVYTLDKS